MGIVITTAGRFRPLLVQGVESMNEVIGSDTFDLVRFADDADMFVDDAGLLKNRPINLIATAIGVESGKSSVIVGDVLILGHDGNGESIDCPAWVAKMLMEIQEEQERRSAISREGEASKKEGKDETA